MGFILSLIMVVSYGIPFLTILEFKLAISDLKFDADCCTFCG